MKKIPKTSLVAAVQNAKFLQHLRERIAQQDQIVLLGDAQDRVQMLRVVSATQPDVLLLDAAFTQRAGICCDSPLLAATHEASPGTKIILLADNCTEHSVARAMQHGARGCMSSSALAEDCLRAIVAVHQGEIWLGRKELAYVFDDLLTQLERVDSISAKSAELLSWRELEIVSEVRLGLTNKQIAGKLRISPTTVKTHLENIFQKLHVTHRMQLARLTDSSVTQPASGTLDGPDSGQV